jgi:DNA-binding transcriptional MerR regulator/methylmalonyl-CoA mutase cobalamin-binding subunit
MNDRNRLAPISLSIAAVERDAGLSKDTLRVWERRYGFPAPQRDAVGERVYPLEQVEKLRIIKRLLDAGHRPGRIVPLPFGELRQLADSTVDQATARAETALAASELQDHVELIRGHDVVALRQQLARGLARFGVARFVTEVIAPLNTTVGDAWMRGQLEMFEEHLYTEAAQVVLRQAIASIPASSGHGRTRVVLTTMPGEPHGLGLLMAEALLALEGCQVMSLGVQTPIWNIVLAAAAHRADIVALGFTGCMNPNQVVEGLQELRIKLPASVRLWAGGSAPVLQRRRIEGVTPLATLDEIAVELRRGQLEAETP